METNTTDVKSVLEKLGYRLSDFGDSWRTSALYRGGDNPTALKVYKNSGVWTDYVDGNKSMPLAALVQKTLGTNDHKVISEYITTKKRDNFQYNKIIRLEYNLGYINFQTCICDRWILDT